MDSIDIGSMQLGTNCFVPRPDLEEAAADMERRNKEINDAIQDASFDFTDYESDSDQQDCDEEEGSYESDDSKQNESLIQGSHVNPTTTRPYFNGNHSSDYRFSSQAISEDQNAYSYDREHHKYKSNGSISQSYTAQNGEYTRENDTANRHEFERSFSPNSGGVSEEPDAFPYNRQYRSENNSFERRQNNSFERRENNSFERQENNSFASGNGDYGGGDNAENRHSVSNSYPESNAISGDKYSELLSKYQELEILYDSRCRELKHELSSKKENEQTIKTLQKTVSVLEGEKERLATSLQDFQNEISEHRHEKNKFVGQINALEHQIAALTAAKDDALSRLESSEVALHSLEKQVIELNRSGNQSRLREQYDNILEEMKGRHRKEILLLKEGMDELQHKLNEKVNESQNLSERNLQLQQRLEQLQLEKSEMFTKLTSELEVSQKKLQLHLESGKFEELSLLKVQVRLLEEKKTAVELENTDLRKEVNGLKVELQSAAALQRITFSKDKTVPFDNESSKDLNLKSELEKSLKNVQSLRLDNEHLRKQLKDLQNEKEALFDRVRNLETQLSESQLQVNELKGKISSLTSKELSMNDFNEKKIKLLEDEINKLQTKLQDVSTKLKETSKNEKLLTEHTEKLEKQIKHLVKNHAEEKNKALEKCREQHIAIHEAIVQKEKEKLTAQAEVDMTNVCQKYNEKILELEKEIKNLNDQLYDSKSLYVAVYGENQKLQAQLSENSRPKERAEIEKEFSEAYEKKVEKMKESLKEQNKVYLAGCLKEEVDKFQLEWTMQKMAEIKRFVEDQKLCLDREFQNCVQKERAALQTKCDAEKEEIRREYERKTERLKEKYLKEKEELVVKFNQSVQEKWKQELAVLKECSESEKTQLKRQLEMKLQSVESELKSLKESTPCPTERQEELRKLEQELTLHRHLWEEEKSRFITSEEILRENLKLSCEMEKKLREKVKKYQHHVTALERRHKEKVSKLIEKLSALQKVLDGKEEQLRLLMEELKNQKVSEKLKETYAVPKRNFGTQTTEEIVSKQEILSLKEQFLQYVSHISEIIKNYLIESKKRHVQRLRSAVLHYHQQMSSKIFRDITKDMRSLPSADTVLNPPISPSAQFKTSTPFLSNPNPDVNTTDFLPTAQTKVKTVHANLTKQVPCQTGITDKQTLSTQGIFNCPETKSPAKNGIVDLQNDRENSFQFADISYDFISMNLPQSLVDLTKFPASDFFKSNSVKSVFSTDPLPTKLF